MDMKRKYSKLAIERLNDNLDIEEAISAGSYVKKYYFEDNTIGRIDAYISPMGLCSVSYHQSTPPWDALVSEHFVHYPEHDVICECVTPISITPDGLRVMMSYYYSAPNVLYSQSEVYLDKNDRVVKRIYIEPDGQRGLEEHLIYNDRGGLLKKKVYSPSGQFLYEDDCLRRD